VCLSADGVWWMGPGVVQGCWGRKVTECVCVTVELVYPVFTLQSNSKVGGRGSCEALFICTDPDPEVKNDTFQKKF